MRPEILITQPMFDDMLKKLQQYFDVTVHEGEKLSGGELTAALQGKEGVLVAGGEKIDAAIVMGLPALRFVCVGAAGYNNIDVAALTEAGIVVTNAPGQADEDVADFAWGLLIAVARRLVEASRWLQQGKWKTPAQKFYGATVHGKTLGIIGMGGIGQAIARRAKGFNMKLYYHNRHRLPENAEEACGAAYASMDTLLQQADYIVLSLPYNKANHHIIGEAEFKKMQSSAILINIARGGLIDETALVTALQKGWIGGAGLDVFEGEPSVYPPLKTLSNVVLTPHIAGAVEQVQHDLAGVAADNLVAAFGYGPHPYQLSGVLNPDVLKK